jgi:hypothetical protein
MVAILFTMAVGEGEVGGGKGAQDGSKHMAQGGVLQQQCMWLLIWSLLWGAQRRSMSMMQPHNSTQNATHPIPPVLASFIPHTPGRAAAAAPAPAPHLSAAG